MDLQEAATRVLEPLGFEVLEVRVARSRRAGSSRVMVRIDRQDENVVSMNDVSLASEVFALELDRLDPFESAFLLEVESPGAKRPLLTRRHFERFHDLRAKVKTASATFTGKITVVTEDSVTFSVDGREETVAFGDIEGAWLAEWPSEPR